MLISQIIRSLVAVKKPLNCPEVVAYMKEFIVSDKY